MSRKYSGSNPQNSISRELTRAKTIAKAIGLRRKRKPPAKSMLTQVTDEPPRLIKKDE